MLLLDPTFVLTRRGQQWIERHERSSNEQGISATRALADAIEAGDPQVWRCFRAMPMSWSRGIEPSRDFFVPMRLHDDLGCHDSTRFQSTVEAVTEQYWRGLLQGHLLVARRNTLLDLFVEAGAVLEVAGPSRRISMVERLGSMICRVELEALLRRTRFLAAIHEEGCGELVVHVLDRGRGAAK